jgi:hypothetical protein
VPEAVTVTVEDAEPPAVKATTIGLTEAVQPEGADVARLTVPANPLADVKVNV